jgi:uncharacterized delta-60 repeat protein
MSKIYTLSLILLLLITDQVTLAQPGLLDNTFGGGDGKLALDFGGGNDAASDLVIQPDGKILVVGNSNINSFTQFALVRLNADGTYDNSFSDDGLVNLQLAGSNYDNATCMALQSDGKIIVGGTSFSEGYFKLVVVRFNSNGTLDATFGEEGVFTYAENTNFSCSSVAIDAAGNILAAGSANLFNQGSQFTVIRITSAGVIDSGFGSAGAQYASFGAQSSPTDMIIQSDGKIVVAGSQFGEFYSDCAITRFNSNGTLDTSFDTDGKRSFALAEYDDYITSIAQLPNGKLLLGGVSNTEFALVQLNSNGTNNTSFSGDGIVLADMDDSFDEIHDIALDDDGNIVVAGHSAYNIYDIAVLRFLPNGTLDTFFNGNGKVTIDFFGTYDYSYAMKIQTNGQIVVAGSTDNNGHNDMAVARIQGVCPIITFEQEITITEGESITVGSNTYTQPGIYEDILDTESGCDSTVITTLIVTVGIDNQFSKKNNINVWPAPFQEELNVAGTNAGDIIIITEISGKRIMELKALSNTTTIPAADLPAGSYILSVVGDTTRQTRHILKVN